MTKDISSHVWLLRPNADGTLDSRYPNGDKPHDHIVVAPVLGTPVMGSTNAFIPFTGGENYTTLIPQYRINGQPTWNSLSSNIYTPLEFSGLNSDEDYQFRALPDNDENNPSNIVAGTTHGFVPLLHINFDGLNDTQAVYGSGSEAGRRFDSVMNQIPFAGGYGVRATTTQHRPGKSSSCAISIALGSDGDPSGGATGVGYGSFGGTLLIPGNVAQGEEIWWGQWLYFPNNWRWDSETPQSEIKFLRFEHAADTSHLDIYVLNGQYSYWGNGDSSSASSEEQSGHYYVCEYNTGGYSEPYQKLTSRGIPLGQWVWIEQYVYAHSDGTQAKRRFWVNGEFVWEIVGENVKWRNNQNTIKTASLSGGTSTLSDNMDHLTQAMLFTYWNGNAPQNQTCYVSDMVIHKNFSTLPDEDEFGNPMMGVNAV